MEKSNFLDFLILCSNTIVYGIKEEVQIHIKVQIWTKANSSIIRANKDRAFSLLLLGLKIPSHMEDGGSTAIHSKVDWMDWVPLRKLVLLNTWGSFSGPGGAPPGLLESLQPCSRAARKWRENEEMRRKWRENEEMERD